MSTIETPVQVRPTLEVVRQPRRSQSTGPAPTAAPRRSWLAENGPVAFLALAAGAFLVAFAAYVLYPAISQVSGPSSSQHITEGP